MKKSLYFILITLFIFGSCTKKSTVTKTTSTGSSTIDSGGSSGSVGSNDSQECGVKTGNDEIDDKCYYTVSPDLIAHGNPISGTYYYHTSLHATEIPQARFKSDQKFQIRIMPKMASQSQQTTGRTPYRTCNVPTNSSGKYTYSKLQVTVELKNKEHNFSLGTKTIYAELKQNSSNGLGWTPSSKISFNTKGHPGEYDIIIKDIKTNHLCSKWGTKDCSTYDALPYVKTLSYPTDCVAFEIHFATDSTRNLP